MDTLLRTLALCCAALAAVNACSDDEFPCAKRWGGNCLAQRWVCDGDNDCEDHSDESQCGYPRTCPNGFFSCASGRCIPHSWVCDGANDCRDSGTDEQNCGNEETTPPPDQEICTELQIACQRRSGNHGCIGLQWVCDGDHDCIDHTDENQCGSLRTCPEDWFACNSGRCIPPRWVCDGDRDCHDNGLDELYCDTNTTVTTPLTTNNAHGNCSEAEYACQSHQYPDGCIPLQFVCDGDTSDCVDVSDERDCGSSRTCPDSWHACAVGRCIPENLVCDGGDDCPDGSDESQCASQHCAEDEFACRSPRRSSGCIPRSWVCDGDRGDCFDGSDERNCDSHAVTGSPPPTTTAQHQCAAHEFACESPRRSGGCIPRSWVCDGDHRDCVDDSDERNCGPNSSTSTHAPVTPGTGEPAVTDAVPQTTRGTGAADAAQGGAVRLELPSWLATDQDAHFALSLAPMLRARAPRDKLDAQMAVLRLFRDLARN